jgi:hypothetical protein
MGSSYEALALQEDAEVRQYVKFFVLTMFARGPDPH